MADGKIESELFVYDHDDGCPTAVMGGGDRTSVQDGWDIAKTEFPFECNDSLGILTPDQMHEFRGDDDDDDDELACCDYGGFPATGGGRIFKMSPPRMLTEVVSPASCLYPRVVGGDDGRL